MPFDSGSLTTDIDVLQKLPELESKAHAAVHMAASCQLTCPWWTSDSIPSACCR
jgi:hypothetical protein